MVVKNVKEIKIFIQEQYIGYCQKCQKIKDYYKNFYNSPEQIELRRNKDVDRKEFLTKVCFCCRYEKYLTDFSDKDNYLETVEI